MLRRKIRSKKSDSAKIRVKFETLRREIKADIRKQHDLYVNNLVGDVKVFLYPQIKCASK